VTFVIINFAFLYFVLELLSFSRAIAASLKLSTLWCTQPLSINNDSAAVYSMP